MSVFRILETLLDPESLMKILPKADTGSVT